MRAIMVGLVLVSCASSPRPDLHEVVACDSTWNNSPSSTTCELACETYPPDRSVAPCGAPPPSITRAGCFTPYKTFDGITGCCYLADGPTIRFYECP